MKHGSTLRRACPDFCDGRHNDPCRLGEAAHIQRRVVLRNLVATQREAPMKRLATSLGTLIALVAMASSAQAGSYAGSYTFSIGGEFV